MIDCSRIDSMALCGYKHAEGSLPKMPRLMDDLDVAAFNAGIENYNGRHFKNVPRIFEGATHRHHGPSGTADKELAIVGA